MQRRKGKARSVLSLLKRKVVQDKTSLRKRRAHQKALQCLKYHNKLILPNNPSLLRMSQDHQLRPEKDPEK